MGSKSRIAKYIVPIIQRYIDENNIDTYVEPFVGGANVIDKINCNIRITQKENYHYMNLFQRNYMIKQELHLIMEIHRSLKIGK